MEGVSTVKLTVVYFCHSASLEDRGSLDAMDQIFPLQDGYSYSTLLSGETSRDGKKNTHLNAASWQELHQIWNSVSFLSGIRASGLLPRGTKKEVPSPWSINLHSTSTQSESPIFYSLRSFKRNRVSSTLSAICWASGSSSGRETGITTVFGNTVSKNQSCTGLWILYCTHISRIHAHLVTTVHACAASLHVWVQVLKFPCEVFLLQHWM